MHRWQTMTLARVEAVAGDHRDLTAAVLSFMVDVNIKYFPEPKVDRWPASADEAVVALTWKTGPRTLVAIFNDDGFAEVRYGPTDPRSRKAVNPPPGLGRHDVPALVYWLLNGTTKSPAT